MNCIQEELQLLPAPSFEELCRRKGVSGLTIKTSTRMRTRWQVSLHPLWRTRTLVVPAMLADAPERVKLALIGWALLPLRNKKKHAPLQNDRRGYEQIVFDWLATRGVTRERVSRRIAGQPALATGGAVYDLCELFDEVNKRFFNGSIKSLIRWGDYASTTSYQSFRRDKDGNRISLITIAGAYNHPDVPRFAIEGVLFHEILHIVIPPFRRNDRRVIHGADFKKTEKQFPAFEQWRAWERDTLPHLVHAMRRSAKRR
jgi:hypothetical protein